jgi:long-chain acyl-CoA synthetase
VNLGELLAGSALRTPDAVAITASESSLTYRDLDDRVNALCHGFDDLGLRPGDRVGCLLPNSPELLETMFACFRAGLGWVPLNAKFRSNEVSFHLSDSSARLLITDASFRATVEGGRLDGITVVATGDDLPHGATRYEELIAGATGRGAVSADVDRDTLAWLFYTSGTTGRPKGAMLTHGVLSFVTASWLADLTPMGPSDVTLHAAPLTHGAGFHALATTARGARHVIAPAGSFDPAAMLTLLARERITNTWMVPTQIIMLADAATTATADLPELRQIVYGGAPFPEAELRRALDIFGPRLVQLYGQGETPMTATVLSADDHAAALAEPAPSRLASAGHPRPGMEVRLVDSDDREVATGDVGEITVRGPAVMTGYWGQPEATEQTLRGGWLHTGDLGRVDDRGYLFLLDRVKDMIITGGSNVYAVEVEAVLREHPSVRDVAVIGVADRKWGEQVVAVIVVDGTAELSPELSPELSTVLGAHCAAQLANYKQPRRYVTVAELPRNAYGKVLKRDLREMVQAG